jgi:hypothetical protein
MNNTEGGTDDEEFRTVAVVDRVNTTLAVWMGTSMACAQCHTHKYDPITHKEYFQVYALLNQTEDADRNDETPLLEFFTAEQEAARERASAELAALHATFRAARERETVAAGEWARAFPARLDWRPAPLRAARAAGKTPVRLEAGEAAVEAGPAKETFTLEPTLPEGETLTALRLEHRRDEVLPMAVVDATWSRDLVDRLPGGRAREKLLAQQGRVVSVGGATSVRWLLPARVLPLHATFDHRLMDGAHLARFVAVLRRCFADPDAALGPAEAE